MSKPSVVKLFTWSLAGLVGGVLLLLAGGVVAYGGDALVMDGPDVVGLRGSGTGVTAVVLAVLGALTVLAGVLGQISAWGVSLAATAPLPDRTWFVVLLVLGVVGLALFPVVGFFAVLAYVIAGPHQSAPLRTDPVPSRSATGPAIAA